MCYNPGEKAGRPVLKGREAGGDPGLFRPSLFTEYANEDGVLLYRCASLNIIEKGPMVSYGVPRHDP